MTDSKRVRPIVRWPGSKSRLVKTLLPLIPPHVCSCEVFGGGVALTLAKERSKVEVINDTNGELISLYLNAQRHLPEVQRQLENIVASRRLFDLAKQHPGLTEIERAMSFLIRNRTSFAGKGEHFGVVKTKGGGVAISRESLTETLNAFHARLDKVIIENHPWPRIIKNYDSPDTFFFFDPPYLDAPTGQYDGWTEEQMQEFGEAVPRLKGKWIVTVDDSKFNRRLFKQFKVRRIVSQNRLCNNLKRPNEKFGELIITPT